MISDVWKVVCKYVIWKWNEWTELLQYSAILFHGQKSMPIQKGIIFFFVYIYNLSSFQKYKWPSLCSEIRWDYWLQFFPVCVMRHWLKHVFLWCSLSLSLILFAVPFFRNILTDIFFRWSVWLKFRDVIVDHLETIVFSSFISHSKFNQSKILIHFVVCDVY